MQALTQGRCAGEGRVHSCLREKLDQLTEGCRREELKLNIIQSRDIRLRPKLNKLCSEEIAVMCKDVKPGMFCPRHRQLLHSCLDGYLSELALSMSSRC